MLNLNRKQIFRSSISPGRGQFDTPNNCLFFSVSYTIQSLIGESKEERSKGEGESKNRDGRGDANVHP